MAEVSLSKEEETYLLIIKELQNKENFGKTLFWKILYFSDFDSYEQSEKSITGTDYRKIQNGPAPCNFDTVIASLKNKNYIKEVKIKKDDIITQIKYILLKELDIFDFKSLTQEERKNIERNISRLGGMTAGQVSEYSHQDLPYKATNMKDIINYDLVFYRNPMFSVSNQK